MGEQQSVSGLFVCQIDRPIKYCARSYKDDFEPDTVKGECTNGMLRLVIRWVKPVVGHLSPVIKITL